MSKQPLMDYPFTENPLIDKPIVKKPFTEERRNVTAISHL